MTENPSTRQKRLAMLLHATSGTIRVEDVMRILEINRTHASRLLAGWHKQGVIRRVAHGLYVSVQPTALGQTQVLENPWMLVPAQYTPGYIGGWSALEHWELTEQLTEQLSRSICVLTHKRTNYGETIHQGVDLFIKYIPEKQLFGTKTIWQGSTEIQISDPHKTLLDCIDDLNLGAGLQHVIDCLLEFKRVFDEPNDLDLLLEYANQINNGALFKKLGYLAEMLDFNPSFVDKCQKRITSGYTILDKNAKNNRLVTRWNLWIPSYKIRYSVKTTSRNLITRGLTMDINAFQLLCDSINDFARSSQYIDREIERLNIDHNKNDDLVAGTNGRCHHDMWVSMKTVSHFNLCVALELLLKLLVQLNNVELEKSDLHTHRLTDLHDLASKKYQKHLESRYQKINRSVNSKGYELIAFINTSSPVIPNPPVNRNISSFRGMLEYFDKDVMLWMKRYSWELLEEGKWRHYLSDISVFVKLVCEVVGEIRTSLRNEE